MKLCAASVAWVRKQSIVAYPAPARIRARGPSATCTRTTTSESAPRTTESGASATFAKRNRSLW